MTDSGRIWREIRDEFLVRLVGQIVHPVLAPGMPIARSLEPRQRQRVDDEGGVERDLRLEAGLGILREKLDAGGAGIECEDRIRLGGARLRQLDGEVELVRPFGVFLAGDRAL
jgi:hypothetical protein